MKSPKKKMLSSKLDPRTIARIKQLSKTRGVSQARIIEHCVEHAPGSEHYRRAEARAVVSDILDEAKSKIVSEAPF